MSNATCEDCGTVQDTMTGLCPECVNNDWAYGSHYNSLGEFNPRLVACDLCGLYAEPEEMTAGKINSITVSLCSICGVNNA
jgi:predicted ATP-dependent serine protease